MTDDAVFLVPGRPPMNRAAFAWTSRGKSGKQPKLDAVSEIKEIHVEGSIAYVWSHLTVTVTPPDGAPPIQRAGDTLTIFRKVGARWLLARDANLLVKV
jgi:uncharacterized protein (TIGR02246 family)